MVGNLSKADDSTKARAMDALAVLAYNFKIAVESFDGRHTVCLQIQCGKTIKYEDKTLTRAIERAARVHTTCYDR